MQVQERIHGYNSVWGEGCDEREARGAGSVI